MHQINVLIKILLCIVIVLLSIGATIGIALLWILWFINHTASCVIITLFCLGVIAFVGLVYLVYLAFF